MRPVVRLSTILDIDLVHFQLRSSNDFPVCQRRRMIARSQPRQSTALTGPHNGAIAPAITGIGALSCKLAEKKMRGASQHSVEPVRLQEQPCSDTAVFDLLAREPTVASPERAPGGRPGLTPTASVRQHRAQPDGSPTPNRPRSPLRFRASHSYDRHSQVEGDSRTRLDTETMGARSQPDRELGVAASVRLVPEVRRCLLNRLRKPIRSYSNLGEQHGVPNLWRWSVYSPALWSLRGSRTSPRQGTTSHERNLVGFCDSGTLNGGQNTISSVCSSRRIFERIWMVSRTLAAAPGTRMTRRRAPLSNCP